MVVNIAQDKKKHKKATKIVTKKVFKDLENFADNFSNCLLKEEQDFLTNFTL